MKTWLIVVLPRLILTALHAARHKYLLHGVLGFWGFGVLGS